MPIAKANRPRRFVPTRHELDQPPRRITGNLTVAHIYGGWWASARDGFFTVRWGRFFAYLHQFDEVSRTALIAACAAGEQCRDRPHQLPEQEG
jgi:hypothetical protein